MDIKGIWDKSLSNIKEKAGEKVVELWFKPTKISQINEQEVTIDVPNRFFKTWIEDNYHETVKNSLEWVLGYPLNVRYRIAEGGDLSTQTELKSQRQRVVTKGAYINPKYTFCNFVVGSCNQFAQAAAKAVADAPAKAYNPLFIYGGVGLGKTHLISAIGNEVMDKRPDLLLLYTPSEQFTNEVVSALRHGKMEELKHKYREVDVLLLDDIQFIANKSVVQEEFFHTFNALYEKQGQIVIASDRPPKDMTAVTDRLRSRFSMGLIADIQPPEMETRLAILHKKATLEGIDIPEEVAYYLASRVKSNIRELEGCLIRLGAQASLTGMPINMEMAKNVLRDIIGDEERHVTVDHIQKVVCEHFALKLSDMKAKKRTKEVALPRQIAMYISKQLTNLSASDIGKSFGKDHATVIYACKQIEERRAKEETFNKMIEDILHKLRR